jgi:hypothetical protein
MEDPHSWLEQTAMRICNLLHGPPTSRDRLANRLDGAIGQLRVELATHREANAEPEALWTLAVRVQDLVVGSADGPSSLAASMSTAAELVEGRIDAAAANGVRWGSRSMLVATVSHFIEMKSELEVLGSKRSADSIDHEVDALWIRVRVASDSLAPHVPSSVAHNPPDVMGEWWW